MSIVLQTKLFATRLCTKKISESVRSTTTRELIYKKFGEPIDVVEMVERKLPPLGKDDVQVQMLAAPVNPSDINTIQGRYPIKPKLPSVGGNEGVGIVTKVGKEVKTLVPGNKVVIIKAGLGTWRTEAIYNEKMLKCVPCELGSVEASTLMVNPCTAYRMLTDFKAMREKKNLVVIQNGANSSVGQNVIQMCKAWGIQNINIVRDRPDIEGLKQYLLSLGATHVLSEKQLPKTDIFKTKKIDQPILGLNCIGGTSSSGIIKTLRHSGMMVTYGGMSKKPVKINTGSFIFKNLSFFGFWMTKWHEKASKNDQDNMLTEIINLICEEKLKAPRHKLIALNEFKEALVSALSPTSSTNHKYILDLSN